MTESWTRLRGLMVFVKFHQGHAAIAAVSASRISRSSVIEHDACLRRFLKPDAGGDQASGVDQHTRGSALFQAVAAQIARAQRDVDKPPRGFAVGAGFAADDLGFDVGRRIAEIDGDKPLLRGPSISLTALW